MTRTQIVFLLRSRRLQITDSLRVHRDGSCGSDCSFVGKSHREITALDIAIAKMGGEV